MEKIAFTDSAARLTLFYLPTCPHCKLALRCLEELKAGDARYQAIAVDKIDESQEKELAESYDYYYVPTFFLGREKLFEGHMEKDDVKAVLDRALEDGSRKTADLDASPEESGDVLSAGDAKAHTGEEGANADAGDATAAPEQKPSAAPQAKSLNGIHGWLLLFFIVQCLGILNALFEVVYALQIGGGAGMIAALVCVLQLALSVACLVLLAKHNAMFRWLFVAEQALVWLMLILSAVLTGQNAYTDGAPPLGGFLWIAYLFLSNRVKVTCGLMPDPGAPAAENAGSKEGDAQAPASGVAD